MKVYVVFVGDKWERNLWGIYSTREKAEEICKSNEYWVKEYEIDKEY